MCSARALPSLWPASCFLLVPDGSASAHARRCGLAKSVLIVDDEKLLVRTLSNALKEAGYRIAVAGSAEQAEKHVFGEPPFDLILLDNRLPKESGVDVVKRVRDRAVRSKVILMTAYETPDVKAEAKRLKVERYMKKPFDLTALLEEIHGLIGNGEGSTSG
ncbi:MAG: response regulator [Candidatus Eisenbacteria bacterium]|uniref:Response regulator n=1 Tax=Eiseniibacteriota bacterium TaxID=2212470 RepID=A0A538S885_UNCEI|nr:MAG: response regulator [Candidatus Eisenbacteria bacterium]TMQ62225.1 MAG: response regulator [Candidatus Eisenbacteria bacterium]